jgi:hypothetical protein
MKSYFVIRRERKWLDAARYCENRGHQLAIVNTVDELVKVQRLAKYEGEDLWLAGNDFAQEGLWRWAKGSVSGD